jgi:hypothetical protein
MLRLGGGRGWPPLGLAPPARALISRRGKTGQITSVDAKIWTIENELGKQ